MKTKKKTIVKVSFEDADDHVSYWKTKSPKERIAAIEILRQRYLDWFYAGTERRVQRILKAVDPEPR